MNAFPSPPRDDENMSFSSSLSQYQSKKSVLKRVNQAVRSRKDEEEEESIYDEEENSDEPDKQDQSKGRGNGNGKFKKQGVLGIQQKAIQKKIQAKNNDSKIKKVSVQQSGPISTFLYKPGVFLPCLSPYLNSMIEIRIAKEYVSKNNPSLMNRLVWGGNGSYSSHSDPVAIAVHHGMLSLSDIKLTTQLYEGIALVFKVAKGKKTLNGSFKGNILSRTLKQLCPHCLKPEKTIWLDTLGTIEQLTTWAKKMNVPSHKRLTKQSIMTLMSYDTPTPHQRTVPDIQLQKMVPPLNEGWIIWNMCNEPAQKYNIITFMDRQTTLGYKSNTSYKLRTHDLFIETHKEKYEIYMEQSMRDDDVFLEQNIYSISEVNEPTRVDLEYMAAVGLPLPMNSKKEILKNLKWEEFIWGQSSLRIKDHHIVGLLSFVLLPLKLYQKNHN